MRYRPAVLFTWLVLTGTSSGTARAQSGDDEIARAHFATGLSYYDENRFAPAVKEFLEAYRLSQRPALLYNIGRSYEKLDDAGRATSFYGRYLAAEPSATDRERIVAVVAAFAPRVGSLVVESDPRGAEVTVDGDPAGVTPTDPLPLTVGEHGVVLRGAGEALRVTKAWIGAGKRSTISLRMSEPNPAAPAPPPPHRRWVWPVIGGAALVVVAAVVVGLVFGLGTDFASSARSGCTGSCFVLDLGSGH